MNIQISSKDFNLTKSIRDYVEKKLSKVDKLQSNQIQVNLKTEGELHFIQIVSNYLGEKIFVSSNDRDLYKAIDDAEEKFFRALRKKKEKVYNKKRTEKFFENDFHEEDNIEGNYIESKIIKRKVFDMKPMDEEEAILQMETLGHNSFMFLNCKTDTMCLLYKRKDGYYGYIEGNH